MDDSTRALLKQFPGAVVLGQATPDELAELDAAAARKYGTRGTQPVKRSRANTALLNAWASLLAPHFANGGAVHFTGTYSDTYGYAHGLMLVRNVMKDFEAFRRVLVAHKLPASPGCIGVEVHPSGRDILHLHALVGGTWSDTDRELAVALWERYRGWSRCKPVFDREGCVQYAAKHLLKQGGEDAFDFWTRDPQAEPSRYRTIRRLESQR